MFNNALLLSEFLETIKNVDLNHFYVNRACRQSADGNLRNIQNKNSDHLL